MRRTIGITLAALTLALSLAGCAAKPSAPQATDRVEMVKSYKFDHEVIQVAPGTVVTWHNDDNFTHSVVFTGAMEADLNLAPGESGTIRFDQPGEFDYVCTYHAQTMKGRVIVSN